MAAHLPCILAWLALACGTLEKVFHRKAWHALEKAKGKHDLGQNCGFWKRPAVSIHVALGKALAGMR